VTAFLVFHRTLHPYFSLFSHFDYRMKRLTRFAFVLGQFSLITLLLWVCYSELFIKWGIADAMGEQRPFYISIFLSIFTLPMPRRLCCFFSTQMYLLQIEPDRDDDEEKQSMKNALETEDGMEQDAAVSQREGASEKEEDEYETRPVLFDRWL